ncbi:MAG TPA: regulatory protein RecX [Tepidiformaceae bacterium]|nr:regulatory protein RecX [Tepidiformaceae bacterium]HMO95666.1 regulatory protein RecX [Tepidiformaceae bacterium]
MDVEPSLTVIGIRPLKRGRQRVIELSDGREFFFSAEAIERVGGVAEGEPITEAHLQDLDAAELRVSAHEAALRLLSARPRSEKEMQTRLAMRGYPPEAIEAEVVRLRTAGLLDDSKFAAAWVEDRRRLAPRGRRMLRYELLGRGIDPEAVEQVTADFDDRAVALELARQKARRAPRDTYEAFVAKVGGFLKRRGFDYEVSAAATRTAWDETASAGDMETDQSKAGAVD